MKLKIIYIPILIFILILFSIGELWAINVSSGLCQEKTSNIGDTYTDVIKIVNNEKTPVEVKLYQTDFSFYSDGTSDYGDPGKNPRSNANWIKQLPQQISIPPGQTSLVQYSVDVPDNQSLSGSYWSMIMVEQIDEGELKSISAGERKLGIRQLVRYGIQVATHIGGSGTRQLEFKGLKLLKRKDQKILNINVENSGTRALRTNFWVDLYPENGGYAKKVPGQERNLYPKCSVMQKMDLSDVPPGTYKAVVVADAGEESVFGTSFSIKLEE